MLGGNSSYPPEGSFFQRPPVIDEGEGLLTVRTIKLGVDGALGSRGAALEQDYSDEPGNTGLVTRDQEALDRLVRGAYASGWQVAIHAIGDRGNRMALDAIAAARAAVPGAGDARPRIEPAQVLRLEDIPRVAELGVVASVQPTHATSDRRWAEARLGPERLAGAYAYASLLRAGAVVACGSDFPVESADPLAGLAAAVTRDGWRLEEALTVGEALDCFTQGAARAAFWEDKAGRLAPGFWADMTILDADPTAVPAARLAHLQVLRTIVGGRITYDGDGAAGR
jgi:predicted amidohydrolase YtcJ